MEGAVSSPLGVRKMRKLVLHTVDGSEIRRSPVEVGSLSHFLQGVIHPRWLFGISSINSSLKNTTLGPFQEIRRDSYLTIPS